MSGYMDFLYTRAEGETTPVTGSPQSTRSEAFRQQYSLALSRNWYPHLHFLAGGVFEKSRTATDIGGTDATAVSTAYRPHFDLTLRSPFVTAGAGYNRQQVTSGPSGGPLSTQIRDRYSGIIAWQQESFPAIALRWEQSDIHDRARAAANRTHESLSFSTRYEPAGGPRLRYDRTVDDSRDNIEVSEVRTTAGSGRVEYGGSWFDNRLGLFASHAVGRQKSEIIESATGVLELQLFALAGLFAVDDTPAVGVLDPAPALIDGATTVGSGITIGLPVTTPGARNLGLDFGSPAAADVLAVWVAWNNANLPAEIANTFQWDVYTSDDNLTWTLHAAGVTAVFDPFRNRFEVAVPSLTARFVKVVVNALTPAEAQASAAFVSAADQQIHVTELQAFRTATPAGPVVSTTRSSNASLRTTLRRDPDVIYDITYLAFEAEGAAVSRQTSLANGLSVSHRFGRTLSGTARAARLDASDRQGDTVAHVYTAGVTATPLPSLSHTASYSGRFDSRPDADSAQHSVFLTNTASLYRGLDVNANGGVTHARQSSGRKTDSTTLMAGATVNPRSNLSLGSSYQVSSTGQQGGGVPELSDVTRRGDLSLAYAPLDTLYLTASRARVSQTGRRNEREQAYSASWSPFRGGALQLAVFYSESRRTTDESVDRLLSQSARWNISSRMFLTGALSRSRSTSTLQESKTSSFVTELRYLF